MVKVFEINTSQFLPNTKTATSTPPSISTASSRTRRKPTPIWMHPSGGLAEQFEFPQINKPGIYVIDFIGAGKSSRALIRKGQLRTLVGDEHGRAKTHHHR